MSRWLALLLLGLSLLVFALFCTTIIDEREQGFRTFLNDPEGKFFGLVVSRPNLSEPGWYVALPGLHHIERYPRQKILFHSTSRPLNTVERTLVDVDYYAIWRIANPQIFFQSNRNMDAAIERISEQTYSEVRETVNKHSLSDLLSPARDDVQREITAAADQKLEPLGIQLVDLRLGATLYPTENLQGVYARMRTERSRFALKFRAEGEQQARGLRSKADSDSQVILAEAEREAQRLRGEGDAEAAHVYAEAYGSDPEFYAFQRSLEVYRKSLDAQTTVVLTPQASFLRYLFDMGGKPADASHSGMRR
jgi:membrane protease subunit HflC